MARDAMLWNVFISACAMNLIAELIGEALIGLLVWLVLLPVFWLISTPIIVLAAIFCSQPYFAAVAEMYSSVTACWRELLQYMV
jgi:hypothetical protein